MFRRHSIVAFAALLLTSIPIAHAANAVTSDEPPNILPFRLTGADGKPVEIARSSEPHFTVVCFLGTQCPLARHYGPRLSKMAAEFANRGVTFVGVNSNSQDSQKDVAEFREEFQIGFPIYKDPANQIADQFGARYMSEVYVLDNQLAVRYRGRVDDQYQPGIAKTQSSRDDLRLAITELVGGKSVSVPKTDTTGCLIGRIKTPNPDSTITFCNQVSRVLNQHCVECHRPGEIGPFSLTDFNEITGWGETIVETVDGGRMPPWNANPEHGHFQNARFMPEADKQILRDWVAAGMPYGNSSDLPPRPEFATGWQLGKEPDLVLKMRDRSYHVPATGTIEYQYFVVDPKFEEDKWVSAAQVIPGNRPTVHHCIVFVRPPDGSDVRGVGYLTGYVPGQRSFRMAPGHARRIPAGSKFVFQMHYTPNGAEQDDLTQVGMTFIPESQVTHEAITLLGIDQEFEIPPQVDNHSVQGSLGWFPKNAELTAIIPHMHVRGKSFQAVSESGDRSNILLDVPRYDFNWQHVYEFATPLPLDSIDKLSFTIWYDNSPKNPANPDPTQTVTWGDQTWEEMAIAFFEVSEPRGGKSEAEPQRHKQKLIVKTREEKTDDVPAEEFVEDFFKRFDKNKDGIVENRETPLGFRRFGFHLYDQNQDGKLTRDEVQTATSRRKG